MLQGQNYAFRGGQFSIVSLSPAGALGQGGLEIAQRLGLPLGHHTAQHGNGRNTGFSAGI